MLLRIRFAKGPRIARMRRKNRRVALAAGALLTPAALMAFALGIWRLAADLSWTGEFAITSGLFSHWQVWLAGAALLQFAAHLLGRYGKAEDRVA